ncbi:uncharacterized protein PV07_08849 [Cladophialophora immunda]|uniref:Uncharacterized protein n=1 Tax=Cladophialophora immunda TaxID=569365 RepID=A0A0D2C393_9EURO|nr:uncharacterized protein PV07_08849 [Cladophialophora immunda]KIW25688.1 hypothetical protein PV07_08849 [Cladophialophora immunda]
MIRDGKTFSPVLGHVRCVERQRLINWLMRLYASSESGRELISLWRTRLPAGSPGRWSGRLSCGVSPGGGFSHSSLMPNNLESYSPKVCGLGWLASPSGQTCHR